MKKIIGKVNEAGTLLVEAMAMLGLIAMVTPVLYKKAAERTVELQDVNASSQLRALSSAVDSYLKDNFARITEGDSVTTTGGAYSYADFRNATSGTVGPISLAHFRDYLPYGFLDGDNARETKIFRNNYQVVIKLATDSRVVDGERKFFSKILTGFVTAVPKNADELGNVRASRIASMVGSNGGYVTNGVAMGAQGIWQVPVADFDNKVVLNDNTFVISSLQPISSQGLANEDVLHRKNEPGDGDDMLNTMETDLFMGSSLNETRNIRLVNQIVMSPDTVRMVGGAQTAAHNAQDAMNPMGGAYTPALDKALYIGNGGGAYLEGAFQAMNSLFSVDGAGIKYFGKNETTDAATGVTTTTRASEPTFKVDSASMVYGNPGAGNAKLTVNSSGSMEFASTAGTNPDGSAKAANQALYADETNFKAGDGNLQVSKDGDKWYTVIGKDATGAAASHEGGHTTYTWTNGVPDAGTDVTGKYEVSVNGSAFVRDTLLTGKLRTPNVDTARLRAGVDKNNFDGAFWDDEFYLVADQDYVVIGSDKTNDKRPKLVIADRDRSLPNTVEDFDIYQGIQMQTPRGEGGIDIRAGNTSLPKVNDEYLPLAPEENTQESIVRIGGGDGVFLTAYDNAGKVTGAPVSIQGDMLRSYKNANYDTIDTFTHQFNLMSRWLYNQARDGSAFWEGAYDHFRKGYANSSYGRVYIADSNVLVAKHTGEVVVDIMPTTSITNPTAKFSGGFAVYDYDYYFNRTDANGNDQNKSNMDDASFIVRKGALEVRTTAATNADKDLTHGEKILVVDNNKQTAATTGVPDTSVGKGSVYIRKGSISLATSGENKSRLTNADIIKQYNNDEKKAIGYIAADRFVSQFKVENNKVLSPSVSSNSANVRGANFEPYEYYEVNPAYTSVMHDIKLATRGGARLSDILPDFINKGIYVVDTTYTPSAEWVPGTTLIPTTEVGDSAENEVSAFAGFIPTPKCPPGYAKVITLTPSGWAMAQAGTPVDNGTVDIMPHNNPMDFINLDPATGDTVQPLTFQKSTWLKAMVLPYCGRFQEDGNGCTDDFRGWGAIMGFIYPHSYYREFINQAGLGGRQHDDDVYWNLFPVYYKQLEGYATVYCYFDRKDNNLSDSYVDKAYDQLSDYKSSPTDAKNVFYYEKNHFGGGNATYINRLNDPNLKYKDPW